MRNGDKTVLYTKLSYVPEAAVSYKNTCTKTSIISRPCDSF